MAAKDSNDKGRSSRDDHLVGTVKSGETRTVHVTGQAVASGQTRTVHDTTHAAEHTLATVKGDVRASSADHVTRSAVASGHTRVEHDTTHGAEHLVSKFASAPAPVAVLQEVRKAPAAHTPHGHHGHGHHAHGHGGGNRRDFLMVATGAVGGVGAALTAWPLIAQMNPDASVKALASVEVDVGQIAEGQAVTIKWRGNPVFIRHRTKAEVEAAKAVPLDDLKDTAARSQLVKDGELATDENRTVKGHEEFMVMMAVCTHLGCVPLGNQGDYAVVEGEAKTGGWFCPCHGSHYDTAGRIRKGPAPENLPVPPYKFLSDTKIEIG